MNVFVEIKKEIPAWKELATLACVSNPGLWLAVHGVSLTAYLGMLDQLESVCNEVERKLARDKTA